MNYDIKGYFQTVIQRLREAFRIEKFSIEEEIDFWNIATEFLSQNKPSDFKEIIQWVDLLYGAPVHLVYQLRSQDKLELVHRHVIEANKIPVKKVRHNIGKENINYAEEIDDTEGQALSVFEQQLNNIEGVIKFKDEYNFIGNIKLSIGNCECLPLYDGNSFWGIYCVGPFVSHPQRLDAKITIVARTISKLIMDIEEHEKKDIQHFEIQENQNVNSFGIGSLNINKIGIFFIQYLMDYFSAKGGVILENQDDEMMVIADHNLSNDLVVQIGESYHFNDKMELIGDSTSKEKLVSDLDHNQISSYRVVPYVSNDKTGFIFLGFGRSQNELKEGLDDLVTDFAKTFGSLVHFKDENTGISDAIIQTYYELLRGIERSKKETYYHTPRVEALANIFARMLGLDSIDKETLLLAAKLHDIGYVGAVEIDERSAMGVEIRHPVIGAMMINMLPVNQEVLNGIRMHHEWINGSGTPNRVSGNDISWTAKIVGILEFITEYIEDNLNNTSDSSQELYDRLLKELLDRTDKQFDMVVVPIAINVIKIFEWDDLIKLGTT